MKRRIPSGSRDRADIQDGSTAGLRPPFDPPDRPSARVADRPSQLSRYMLAPEPRPDHAAYVASWLRVLRGDKRAIFTAAAKAQQAADWMHARQPAVAEPAEEVAQARAA